MEIFDGGGDGRLRLFEIGMLVLGAVIILAVLITQP